MRNHKERNYKINTSCTYSQYDNDGHDVFGIFGETKTVDKFIMALNQSKIGTCKPRHNAKLIMCIVHTTSRESDEIVRGIVYQAHALDVRLREWNLP